MPKAAVIPEKGGPDVFRYEDIEVGDPGSGEVYLKYSAIGVNYADTYHRGGMSHPWPVGEPPVVVGFKATGEVLEVGPGVEEFAVGDQVVYQVKRVFLNPYEVEFFKSRYSEFLKLSIYLIYRLID